MPREQIPIRPIKVDYKCDDCGKGYYRPEGNVLMTAPPQFPHRCTECDTVKVFYEKYPTIRYAREGELIDLDNYKQKQY